MLALAFILVAVVVLIAGVFVVARELDRRDDRRERDARRHEARLERQRRELVDLNDGSWPAFLAEIHDYGRQSARSAA